MRQGACAPVLSGDVWSRISLTACASDAVSSPCAKGRLTLRRLQSALAFCRTKAMMSAASSPPLPPPLTSGSRKPASTVWLLRPASLQPISVELHPIRARPLCHSWLDPVATANQVDCRTSRRVCDSDRKQNCC